MRRNDFVDKVARVYDVPPWVIGDYHRPRFARLRWALRRVWPVHPIPERSNDGS